ncbi:MAG: helix-turn-helix transcriptional regulator [Acidimicrobiia bacterium]|nr:helix-turn-helix transcriptional regulator [Acidimicrobiia bacterium]
MTDRHEAVYVISVAAEIVGMHPQTLRGYEQKGLVEPFRTPGGTRRYSQYDLERLQLIQELSNAGVNLEGIARILDLRRENSRLQAQVARLRRLLEDSERRRGGISGTIVGFTRRPSNPPDVVRDDPLDS